MQKMQKMLVFPTKNSENMQNAITVQHLSNFSTFFLWKTNIFRIFCIFPYPQAWPKAVSTLSHQTGISQNAENVENVCISNKKYRKRAKSRDCGIVWDFSAFIFGKTHIFCIFCLSPYPQARPQSSEHAEPSNRNLPKCRKCRTCWYFQPKI